MTKPLHDSTAAPVGGRQYARSRRFEDASDAARRAEWGELEHNQVGGGQHKHANRRREFKHNRLASGRAIRSGELCAQKGELYTPGQ